MCNMIKHVKILFRFSIPDIIQFTKPIFIICIVTNKTYAIHTYYAFNICLILKNPSFMINKACKKLNLREVLVLSSGSLSL